MVDPKKSRNSRIVWNNIIFSFFRCFDGRINFFHYPLRELWRKWKVTAILKNSTNLLLRMIPLMTLRQWTNPFLIYSSFLDTRYNWNDTEYIWLLCKVTCIIQEMVHISSSSILLTLILESSSDLSSSKVQLFTSYFRLNHFNRQRIMHPWVWWFPEFFTSS